jgi:F-type H+-transporting ATPase subunit delta
MKVSVKKYAYALANALKDETDVNTVNQRVSNFLQILKKKGELNILKDFITTFKKIWRKENNMIKVEVTLPKELNESEETELKSQLEKSLNKEVIIEKKINPKVLGGMKLVIEDEIILDNTLTNRLSNLKRSIS